MTVPRNIALPNWLSDLNIDAARSADAVEVPFPYILRDCLYYPASGVDGRPVQYLSGFVHSFVYADYGLSCAEVDDALRERGFKGYQVALRRALEPGDLHLRDWPRPAGAPRLEGWTKRPWATWFIFKRMPDFGAEHGPARFSHLFMGTEGVSTYKHLFLQNVVVPKVIAIIQPGTGFGGNYTDFRDPHELFARMVKCQELPQYMMCEGEMPTYENAYWPDDFPCEIMRFQHPRGNGLWGRSPLAERTDPAG